LTTLWARDAVLTNWYIYASSLEKSGGVTRYLDFGTKVLTPTPGFWVNKPKGGIPSCCASCFFVPTAANGRYGAARMSPSSLKPPFPGVSSRVRSWPSAEIDITLG
jgi:hypothetical protein